MIQESMKVHNTRLHCVLIGHVQPTGTSLPAMYICVTGVLNLCSTPNQVRQGRQRFATHTSEFYQSEMVKYILDDNLRSCPRYSISDRGNSSYILKITASRLFDKVVL